MLDIRRETIAYDKVCDQCSRDMHQTAKDKEIGDTIYWCFYCNREVIRHKQQKKKGKLSVSQGVSKSKNSFT